MGISVGDRGVAVLDGRLIFPSCQEWGSFTNVFSSNPKTLNLKIFANHERR